MSALLTASKAGKAKAATQGAASTLTADGARQRAHAIGSAAEMIRQLHAGLSEDLQGYGALRELLQRQFHAALSHQAEAISELSSAILTQAAELDAQRARRRELLVALLGRQARPDLRTLIEKLPDTSAAPLAALRRALDQALSECKALNLRNAQLISEQQALMQQLLGREEHVYEQR
ncbi:MAG: flagellar export chaperone FlgN [Mitsuaria chitosanitabida]|uniref:flagellar export chaperone FlgN n=1 Tax=Roseateles chitosanitabidus TaxID=65048 RepID=UPI001B05F225|nr:flagellar export chaperone FlgN [Roseateles chitosanitabidus]MBO9689678.1 flagellar export chaperone FlgN [Roseateles chitosanitabidus]